MLIALYSTSILLVDRGYGGFVEGIFVEIKQYDHDRLCELLELIATTADLCRRDVLSASSAREQYEMIG